MAITVTPTIIERNKLVGGAKAVRASLAVSGTYETNGFALTAAHFGLMTLEDVIPMSGAIGGYTPEWDRTNKKFKLYRSGATASGAEAAHTHAAGAISGSVANESTHTHAAGAITGTLSAGSSHNHAFTGNAEYPILRLEESKTVTAHACTLNNVPLYIVAVHVTAGGTTGAFNIIPTGETPLTKQVAVNFTTGAMAFLDTDAVTAALVTYIPNRGSGLLSAVTVDESVVAAAATVNTAARAGLIQYIWDDTDGVLDTYEQVGTEPSATHKCEVDINNGGSTTLDFHALDEGNTIKITYVPFSQLPPGCFIDDTDITLNAEAWNFTGDPLTNGYNNLVVPGFGTQIVGETGAAALSLATWEGPSGTAANGVATWNPATNAILTNQDTAMTIASMPWMILSPLLLIPATPSGSNAAEAAHTHTQGSLVGAASAAGSAHLHAVGTLAGATSAAGSSHTHTTTAALLSEVTAAVNIGSQTLVVLALGV